MVVNIGLIA